MRNHSLLTSFKFAFAGLRAILHAERNIRIHILFGLFILWFAQYFGLSAVEWAITVAIIFEVIILECINTVIERVVDMIVADYNIDAKFIKDVSAAFTMLGAGMAVVIGLIIFFRPHVLIKILTMIFTNPLYTAAFIIYIAFSIFVIRRDRR